MVRRTTGPPDDAEWTDSFEPVSDDDDGAGVVDETQPGTRPSLEGLSIAGITRRRAAFALGAFVSIWIIAVFARQVGDASAAVARAERIRVENQLVATNVAALQAELELIQKQEYIVQQARAYGLGTPRERPFELAPDASSLPADAAGSAAVRLGAEAETRSPLETWLSVLFGPDPGRRE